MGIYFDDTSNGAWNVRSGGVSPSNMHETLRENGVPAFLRVVSIVWPALDVVMPAIVCCLNDLLQSIESTTRGCLHYYLLQRLHRPCLSTACTPYISHTNCFAPDILPECFFTTPQLYLLKNNASHSNPSIKLILSLIMESR